jgi:serine/threonine-protein kinase
MLSGIDASFPIGLDPRPLFGALAIRLGYTSSDRVREALGLQERLKDTGISPHRLGDILLAKGFLTGTQQCTVLKEQAQILKFPSVPGYRILALLGKGSFGSVWKGLQLSMERPVALKGMSPERSRHSKFRECFLQEARAVARLNHPHIVQGIDIIYSADIPFLILEFIDGPTIGRLLRRQAVLSPRKSLRIVTQIASALHHAHAHGIIHRDIKPENIMLTRSGVAKLCDLGLAKLPGGDPLEGTRRRVVVGTADYISPEQARGERSVDTRSDIYSLGAALFHMVTGRVPFPGQSRADAIAKHLSDPVPSARLANSSLSPEIDTLIQRMMAKRPEDRFQTPKDLYRELEKIRRTLPPSA